MKHTAISGLSAKTYSCGGDGSLFGRGGDASTLRAADGFGAFEKNLRIPSFSVGGSLSSSDGTEDRSEESSEEAMMWLRCGVSVVLMF